MLTKRNLYADLGLQPSASLSEIRTAYRRAALLCHPDKGGSATSFHTISSAFEVLSSPTSRALYDRTRKHALRRQNSRKHSKAAAESTWRRRCHAARGKRKAPFSSCEPRTNKKRSASGCADVKHAKTSQGSDPAGEFNQGTLEQVHRRIARLRSTLKDLLPPQRREAIAQMPPQVRSELLAFMSRQHTSGGLLETRDPNGFATQSMHGRHKSQLDHEGSWSRGTDLRMRRHVHCVSYQAQLRFRHLRIYTRGHADLNTAISYQMALVQARHAINAAKPDIWDRPADFCKVFIDALNAAGTTLAELGLSVFVFMRADEWIGRFATITSPVMTLEAAVAVHARLLVARQISWLHVRKEWVQLMLQTQQAKQRGVSLSEAEALADGARTCYLEHRLKHDVAAVERAVRLRGLAKQRVMRSQMMTQQRLQSKRKAAARLLEQKRRAVLVARRKWYRRMDLTMEEILQGPPREA